MPKTNTWPGESSLLAVAHDIMGIQNVAGDIFTAVLVKTIVCLFHRHDDWRVILGEGFVQKIRQ